MSVCIPHSHSTPVAPSYVVIYFSDSVHKFISDVKHTGYLNLYHTEYCINNHCHLSMINTKFDLTSVILLTVYYHSLISSYTSYCGHLQSLKHDHKAHPGLVSFPGWPGNEANPCNTSPSGCIKTHTVQVWNIYCTSFVQQHFDDSVIAHSRRHM